MFVLLSSAVLFVSHRQYNSFWACTKFASRARVEREMDGPPEHGKTKAPSRLRLARRLAHQHSSIVVKRLPGTCGLCEILSDSPENGELAIGRPVWDIIKDAVA